MSGGEGGGRAASQPGGDEPHRRDGITGTSTTDPSAPAAPEKPCETCGGKGHFRAHLGEGCVEHHLHDDQCQHVCCSACGGRGKA